MAFAQIGHMHHRFKVVDYMTTTCTYEVCLGGRLPKATIWQCHMGPYCGISNCTWFGTCPYWQTLECIKTQENKLSRGMLWRYVILMSHQSGKKHLRVSYFLFLATWTILAAMIGQGGLTKSQYGMPSFKARKFLLLQWMIFSFILMSACYT